MDILDLTEDQAAWLPGYEKFVLQWRVAKTPEDAKLAALLMWVIDFGNVSQLEKVLAAGANPNVVYYPRGSTPLGMAFSRFHKERATAVRLLLDAGADPRVPSERGETPLMLACKSGSPDLINLVLAAVLKAGKPSPADLNAALWFTAFVDNVSAMKQLLSSGAQVNARSRYNPSEPLTTALMAAASQGHVKAVKVLLEAGADVNLKDDAGHTALDYALADPKAARKIAPLLQQAGALSGKPFAPVADDEPTRGFATAARKPAFKRAVARIKELTGIAPGPLEGPEDTIPGGYGFLLDENPNKTFVEGGVAEYLGIHDRARHFVEQHHSEILALGAYLFHTRDLMKQNGTALALLPTTDVYRVIAAVETECDDSCAALIAWLRNLEKDQPFLITGVGRDFIEGKFTTPIQDPAALVKRINEICPSEDTSSAAEQRAINLLRETNRLFLWWD